MSPDAYVGVDTLSIGVRRFFFCCFENSSFYKYLQVIVEKYS
jgi:hypothetical protein